MGLCASDLTTEEKVNYLSATPLFTLEHKHLFNLAKQFKVRHYEEAMPIITEGEIGTELFVVCEGEVEIYAKDANDKEIVLGSKRKGTFFGHQALFQDNHRRKATVMSTTATQLLVLSAENFAKFLLSAPQNMRERIMLITGTNMSDDLKQIPFLSTVDQWKLELLASLFEYQVEQKGTVIFRQGELGDKLYIISEGSVKVNASDIHDNNVEIAELGKGQYFGEIALFCSKGGEPLPRTATLIANSKVLLLTLAREDFVNFFELAPEVEEIFQAVVRQRTAELFKSFDIPFFACIPDDKLHDLSQLCRIEEYDVDKPVFLQGDQGKSFYIIIFGCLKVYRNEMLLPDGKDTNLGAKKDTRFGIDIGQNLKEMGPGEYFGEIALVRNTERSASVIPSTRCVLMTFSRDNFNQLFRGAPELRSDFEIRLAKDQASIEAVLTHNLGLKYFSKQLAAEYSKENIDFYKAVQKYKGYWAQFDAASTGEEKEDAQKRISVMAGKVIDTFIEVGAPEQVNVPDPMRKKAILLRDEAPRDMFDAAEKEVIALLKKDSFPRFKQSAFFRRLLADVGAYDGNADEIELSVVEDSVTVSETPALAAKKLPPLPKFRGNDDDTKMNDADAAAATASPPVIAEDEPVNKAIAADEVNIEMTSDEAPPLPDA